MSRSVAAGIEPKRALVTGLTGQDGSFLAELLLDRGYNVIGMIRPSAPEVLGLAKHLEDRVQLLEGDLFDSASLRAALAKAKPDEVYHLAAPSFVPEFWQRPARTLSAIAGATATLLEGVREHSRQTRMFVAGSGAMFGSAPDSPQREYTPCWPETPYATAKLASHQLVGQLRGMTGCLPAPASSTTTSPSAGRNRSSPGRSAGRLPRSSWVSLNASSSAT